VRELRRQFPRIRVVAVLAFPRAEHRRGLCDAGVSALLGKPLLLADLFWCLGRSSAGSLRETAVPA
jgi:hypothetical protein